MSNNSGKKIIDARTRSVYVFMKKIILASKSEQRKKLLEFLNVKFEVIASNADEITEIKSSCADLVKQNALLKAKEVASHLKDGIVIGADTVVYVGNKEIIGKPKDLKDAKRILKLLFSRPHWVYSGIAVIDVKAKKTIVDYEKTKIFMAPLTDKEISNYHKRIAPFDKAGGFDIEGAGSVFIEKINGCYTNVIGMPMAKLHKMLKSVGINLLGCFCLVLFLSSCTTEYNLATKRQETLMYGTEKEISIGNSVSQRIEKEYKVIHDIDVEQRVEGILDRLVEVSDRNDLVYYIKVLDDKMINAVSLPGGYVYIFKGMYDKLKNDDQLAAVVAHEIGHITAKHSMKKLQGQYGAMLLQLLAVETQNSRVAYGVNFALSSVFMEYSQADEFEADKLSVKYTKKAGYDASQVLTVLEVLKKEQENDNIKPFSYWRTHPYISQRIAIVRQELTGDLQFKDYLNLIDTY